MKNPMLSLLNPQSASPMQSSPDVSGVVNLYKAYKAAENPAAALQQMVGQNPMLAQVRQMQQSGTNMEQMFHSMCKQQGVDPQSILSQFE